MHGAAASLSDCDGAPLRLHIGIASGEVVAANIIAGGKSKYSVTGTPVNLAARLVALARPGDTLMSDSLHRSVLSAVGGAERRRTCTRRDRFADVGLAGVGIERRTRCTSSFCPVARSKCGSWSVRSTHCSRAAVGRRG
jgi:class 3 adenylate cyclase